MNDVRYTTKAEVELMIERRLNPIESQLTEIRTHGESLYGNSSGRKGYIERMEEKQDERWDQQSKWNSQAHADVEDLVTLVKSKLAVGTDRKFWIGLLLMAIPALLATIHELKSMFGSK